MSTPPLPVALRPTRAGAPVALALSQDPSLYDGGSSRGLRQRTEREIVRSAGGQRLLRGALGITFRGMTSDEATTTAVVRTVPGLDLATYVDCLDATHRFKRKVGCTCDFDAVDRAWRLTAIAGMYSEGTVVERLVDRVMARPAGPR